MYAFAIYKKYLLNLDMYMHYIEQEIMNLLNSSAQMDYISLQIHSFNLMSMKVQKYDFSRSMFLSVGFIMIVL